MNRRVRRRAENSQIFAYFMKHKYCYDIMPKSAKIVIFDTQLLVSFCFLHNYLKLNRLLYFISKSIRNIGLRLFFILINPPLAS